MRLIVPIEYYRRGGVEREIYSIIKELGKEIEQIILILPKKEIVRFQNALPNSEAIVYESLAWEPLSVQCRIVSLLNKFLSLSVKIKAQKIEQLIKNIRRQYETEFRIRYLAREYKATHCLYFLTNRLTPPNLDIPLAMVSHDVFWRFAPLTYPESYVKEYDLSLLEWLNKVDLVFTVSEKTRRDILSIFPGFSQKIQTIPNSGLPAKSSLSPNFSVSEDNSSEFITEVPIFYYPSSFGIYKDHLTIIKAGIKLAQKNLKFKIVLIGKETDNLIAGKISLSQQSHSQEYVDYLHQCQQIYQNNENLIKEYFEGLGYSEEEVVERWYQKCSCVVVPSKYEGFGLALSEAIVRGLPVIASNLEVFQEQVELYKCGDRVDFFPVSDVEALANCMEQLLLNPKNKLSAEEADKRFSNWTWNHAAKQYIDFLEQL
jgi:glycosyltransferase involved in cell wall biosynthesis